MKKKGFTLIELLAVIVILAIIALIAIPLIGNVIEKAKIGALENSVNGLVESANMYYANQSIKGEQATETIFDFNNGEQISTEKLEYKGKVYNGKLILHANGEIAVCVDNEEHYAYKNKDSDEIMSGVGTCVYDGTTGDFSSNSSIKDLRGKTVVATNITQSADGLSTLIKIPEEGHYDETSYISILNSNLDYDSVYGSIKISASSGVNTIELGFKPKKLFIYEYTRYADRLVWYIYDEKISATTFRYISNIGTDTTSNLGTYMGDLGATLNSITNNGFTVNYTDVQEITVNYIAFK